MDTRQAFTSQPFNSLDFVTAKPIHERNVPKELQIHARFRDKENGRLWDVDIYLLLEKVMLLEGEIPKWKQLYQDVKCSSSLIFGRLRR